MAWFEFFVLLTACFAAGSTGMLFPTGAWYDALSKPSWTPPNWLFPVAWSILYFMIAAGGAQAVSHPNGHTALAFWALQMVFNTLWTPVFFGLKRMRAGMVVMVGLWVSVLCTCIALFDVSVTAGLLFVPYLIWVSYAAALNWALLQRNSQPI